VLHVSAFTTILYTPHTPFLEWGVATGTSTLVDRLMQAGCLPVKGPRILGDRTQDMVLIEHIQTKWQVAND
jgi:hypothetical protein